MMTGQVCGPIENGKKQTTINRSRTKKAKKGTQAKKNLAQTRHSCSLDQAGQSQLLSRICQSLVISTLPSLSCRRPKQTTCIRD